MRKKIEFSMAATTGEIKAIFDSGLEDKIALALAEESERRDFAISVANHAKCGLHIHVYEYKTEYFLDFDMPEGEINEQHFGGMTDDRN